jgi:hypothetical protein
LDVFDCAIDYNPMKFPARTVFAVDHIHVSTTVIPVSFLFSPSRSKLVFIFFLFIFLGEPHLLFKRWSSRWSFVSCQWSEES